MEAGSPEHKRILSGGPVRRTRDRTGQRVSRVVFTLNNWTDEEYSYLTKEFAPKCRWMVIGKEIGENGTKHLQGTYFYL